MRLLALALTCLLTACATQPLTTSAAAVRLADPQRLERVVAIVQALPLSERDVETCTATADAISSLQADLQADMKTTDVGLRYTLARDSYLDCRSAVLSHTDTMDRWDRAILERWDRDVLALDEAIANGIEGAPSGQTLSDLATLLPVLVQVLVML